MSRTAGKWFAMLCATLLLSLATAAPALAATQLAAPTNLKVAATANADGTFEIRADWYQGGNWPGGETIDAKLLENGTDTRLSPSSTTYSQAIFKNVPATYANKKLTFTVQASRNLFTPSDIVSKDVTLPASVVKPTEADLKRAATASIKNTTANYGGALKRGTKSTWTHGLYTFTAQVTNVTSKAYTAKATISTVKKVAEVYADSSNPTNHYFRFGNVALNGSNYSVGNMGSADYLYSFSNGNLTCTMTMEIAKADCKSGWNALAFRVDSHNVCGGGSAGIAAQTYWLEFTQVPGAPYASTLHGAKHSKVTKNSISLDIANKAGKVNYQYRVKGAKAWKSGSTTKAYVAVKKLKAGATYELRFQNVSTSKNRAGTSTTLKSKWSPIQKIATAPTAKPAIKSISISGFKSSRYWQKGHWTSYSSTGVWVPGKYVNSTSYKVTIKLKKKVKGANGVEVVYGKNTAADAKLSKDGKTITLTAGGAKKGASQSFKLRMFANSAYENDLVGYGPWSAKKSAKVSGGGSTSVGLAASSGI